MRLRQRRLSEITALAQEGLTRAQVAERLSISYPTVVNYGRMFGIPFSHGSKGAWDNDRADAMAAMYRAGKTLAEIGAIYGVTRERVRQIISKFRGVAAVDGGQAVRAKIQRARRNSQREIACLKKNGCSTAELRELRKIGRQMMADGHTIYQTPIGAFRNQRSNAQGREIAWELTLWDWWQIWQQSGKWNERGRHCDGYVMCRFADDGPYAIGNVYIATLRHNSTVQPNNPFRKGHPDFEKVTALKNASRKKRRCSEPECDRPHYALGACKRHYDKNRYACSASHEAAA